MSHIDAVGQARRIVRLAVEGISPDLTQPRAWLERDEYGTWERAARELATEGEAKRHAAGMMSRQAMEQEAACVLKLRALRACLEHNRSERGNGPRS